MPDMRQISLTPQKTELSIIIKMIGYYTCLAHGGHVFNMVKKIGDFHKFHVKFTYKKIFTARRSGG